MRSAAINWFFPCAYLLGLYASLPVMPQIWRLLDQGLNGHGVWIIYAATFVLFLVLVVYMYVRGVRSARAYLLFGIFCTLMASLGYFEENPGEKIHMIQYAILALLVSSALRKHMSGSGLKLYITAAIICYTAGAVDELIQLCLNCRSFTWHDILVNGTSSALVLLIIGFCLADSRQHPSKTILPDY